MWTWLRDQSIQSFEVVRHYYKKHEGLKYYTVFLLAFLLFAYLQNTPGMADPDSFYHIRMAQIIRDQGVPRDFPWLPYTIFSEYFTDHHMLYHIVLIPFVTFLPPVIGAKLSQALFASLTVLTFYWLIKKMNVPFPAFFATVLGITSPFIFRLSLIKVPALSIIVLMIGVYLIVKKKWPWLFGLSFFFVWLYGGFLLIVVATGIFVFVEGAVGGLIKYFGNNYYNAPLSRFLGLHKLAHEVLKIWVGKRVLLISAAAIVGVMAGILINPYFPKNLTFYWEQVIQIGLVNYQNIIAVGGEWYPYPFGELVSATAFVWMTVLAALTLSVLNWKRITKENISLFGLAMLFFLFTLKSRRYVEYFVPFTLLWCAIAVRDAAGPILNWATIGKQIKEFYANKNQRAFAAVATIYFLIGVPYLAYVNIQGTKNSLTGYSADKYQGAGQWLEHNTQQGDIVFHNDWDDFPILFYQDIKNYYIVGLDPTFMYKFDKRLYWEWVNITVAKQSDHLYEAIKGDFKAKYVFLDNEHQAFENNLIKDGHFSLVYKDQETRIFKVL